MRKRHKCSIFRVEELLNSVIDRPGPPASDDESNRSDGATSKASSKANHSKVDKKEVDKEEEEEKARGKAGRWILEVCLLCVTNLLTLFRCYHMPIT